MPSGRVLMIAHHFPPAGGSGSNRALAMARFLPEFGWIPTVLTPGVEWAANRDDGLARDVPADVRVVRTRSLEPRPAPPSVSRSASEKAAGSIGAREEATRGVMSPRSLPALVRPGGALRSQLGHLKRFPDAHAGWVPFAVAAGLREPYDVAYSSSGPFSSHLVGLLLALRTRKPWVLELRDGWYRWNKAIFPDYPAWRDFLERRLERLALRKANRVVLVTDRMAEAFRAQHVDLPSDHFAVVPNGFDPSQFDSVPPAEPMTGQFVVLHSGSLYYGRSVAAFLRAVADLLQRRPDVDQNFSLLLLGTLDRAAREEVEAAGLGAHVRFGGQVDHATSRAAMRRADLLLLVANTTAGAEATVPGKLFEYLAVGKPILALAQRASSTRDVLERTGAAYVADPNDPAAIAAAVERAFDDQQQHHTEKPDSAEVGRYDRRVLAGYLARTFDQVVDRA